MKKILDEIRKHVCDDKHIVSADNPIKLMLGFECNCGEIWHIRLTDVKQMALDDPLRESFRTKEGRRRLEESLSSWTGFLSIGNKEEIK